MLKIKKTTEETISKQESVLHTITVDEKEIRIYEHSSYGDFTGDQYDYGIEEDDLILLTDEEQEIIEDNLVDIIGAKVGDIIEGEEL